MADILGDLSWRRGDSYPITLTIKDKSVTPSVAINITGYSFKMTVTTVKDPVDETTQLFQVIGEVDADQGANTGKVHFTPSAVDTDQLSGKYFYDVEMTDASGNIRTISPYGAKFTLNQDQTKT